MKRSNRVFEKYLNAMDELHPPPVEYGTPEGGVLDFLTGLLFPKARVGRRGRPFNHKAKAKAQVIIGFLMIGLASCAMDIVVDRGVVVDKVHVPGGHGNAWVNGKWVWVHTEDINRLVLRVDGQVVEVPVKSSQFLGVVVGDTIPVRRYEGSKNWKLGQ